MCPQQDSDLHTRLRRAILLTAAQAGVAHQAIAENTSPGSRICAGTCPVALLANWGRMAMRKITVLGLEIPAMNPWAK
jgi:hypothetical protein